MDPIHPIVPTSSYPAAVERLRRIARAGDEPREDERREPRRKAAAPVGPDAAAPAVDGDGHLDARA